MSRRTSRSTTRPSSVIVIESRDARVAAPARALGVEAPARLVGIEIHVRRVQRDVLVAEPQRQRDPSHDRQGAHLRLGVQAQLIGNRAHHDEYIFVSGKMASAADVPHSTRKASIGSILAARRAGR